MDTCELHALVAAVVRVGTQKAILPIARVCVYIALSIAGFVAPTALDQLKRLNSKIRWWSYDAFISRERFLSQRWPKRKLKILFSRESSSLEKRIKGGFYDTPHVIAFDVFSPRNIRDYDLIVPLTLPDLKYLNEVRNLIIDNPIPIPSLESILLCDDKYSLNESLAANGFGRFIPKMGEAPAYPYILKKRIDLEGKNSHLIVNKQQEQRFSNISNHPEYFSQKFMKGAYEYATHILFKNQRIVHAINIEYKFNTETPIKGKDNAMYTMICHCPYLDVFTAMLTSVGFNGLCCVNYKVCDNHLFLLEINPRFGGSLGRYFFSFLRHVA